MNKSVVASILLVLSVTACKHTPQYAGTGNRLTERDLHITKKNSYSDLFLDSSAVEKFISRQKLNDTIANDMRSFYNARNFQFAWFCSDGLTEQALAFNSLYDYTQESSPKILDRKMDELMIEDSLALKASDADIVKTELSLTWRFINYTWQVYKDADIREGILEESVPKQKMPVLKMGEQVISARDYISNPLYDRLKNQLKIFMDSIGSLPDTGAGRLTKESQTIKVQRLLINMERMKWMPAKPGGKLILVNIPEFKLYVKDNDAAGFNMDVIVGKEGHNTVMFSGKLNQVVFCPYWNLPQSIVRKEILPAMEKNKNYLEEKNMEITGEENGLPVIRQLPGERNDLGRVKFLFPNSFNIYFHDTPYKELFRKNTRAYSHGCIRLSDPVKLAAYLLHDQPGWTAEKIDSAMNSGKEKYVKVKEPVPVLIYYYTAWIDNNGLLKTAADIYGHDARSGSKMFTDPRH